MSTKACGTTSCSSSNEQQQQSSSNSQVIPAHYAGLSMGALAAASATAPLILDSPVITHPPPRPENPPAPYSAYHPTVDCTEGTSLNVTGAPQYMAEPKALAGEMEVVDVVVIGGGVAGLSAARKLIGGGLSTLLLEATDSLGGRVRTEVIEHPLHKPYKFELGAAWIHGLYNNPFYENFKTLYEKRRGGSFSDQLFHYFSGNAWNMPEIVGPHDLCLVDPVTNSRFTTGQIGTLQTELVRDVRPKLRSCPNQDMSVFAHKQVDLAAEQHGAAAGRLSSFFWMLAESFLGTGIGEVTSGGVFAANESHDNETQGCFPGPHCSVLCGMNTFVQLLVEEVEDAAEKHRHGPVFRLKTPVASVSARLPQGNVVTLANGSKVLARKGVVCASSLVSTQKNISLPPSAAGILSTYSQTSHVVYYRKVLFAFEHCFWPANARLVGMCPSQHRFTPAHVDVATQVSDICEFAYDELIAIATRNAANGHIFRADPKEDEQDGKNDLHVALVWENHYYSKGVPVLSCSIVGELGRRLVALPEDVIYALVFRSIRRIYSAISGNKASQCPQPLWARTVDWGGNPYFRQSYTLHNAINANLANGLDNIFFCGEHIEPNHTGTVHASIITAEASAEALVSIFDQDRIRTNRKIQRNNPKL